MHGLAGALTAEMGRLVIDQTNLPGSYNLLLRFASATAALPDRAGPSVFKALEEQLGLKLEARKQPVEVIVINRAERPGAN